MVDPNDRVQSAARARDERLILAWLEASTPTRCPGCTRPLKTTVPGSGKRGRTRVWCSDACRQRAYRARRAEAQNVEIRVTQATGPPAPTEHKLDQCIVAVLESPQAVASVLDVVRRALMDDALETHEYADVRVAMIALRDAMDSCQR
ncbi:MAG: hypothetical protein ABIR39_23425 [Nocardioides sp.]|uniref:hypothetical protein n=1 Tax=Nocardioides sp. TaxID=35761 RepID=UPI00326468BE